MNQHQLRLSYNSVIQNSFQIFSPSNSYKEENFFQSRRFHVSKLMKMEKPRARRNNNNHFPTQHIFCTQKQVILTHVDWPVGYCWIQIPISIPFVIPDNNVAWLVPVNISSKWYRFNGMELTMPMPYHSRRINSL